MTEHLFFECRITRVVWEKCDKLKRLSSVHHNQFKASFQQFHILDLNVKHDLIWKGKWVAIIWRIWNDRNRVVLRQGKIDCEEIWYMVQMNPWHG